MPIIVSQKATFMWICPDDPLASIELAGRTCYKSEDKITPESKEDFVRMLLKRGHEAMIEHAAMSYKVITDRGVSHEFVRHRLFSYAQESTRYCNYGKSNGISVICPGLVDNDAYLEWKYSVVEAETHYLRLLDLGVKPEIARSVLPTCLKTELVVTGNLREWRRFFSLRTKVTAHPQMRELANMILRDAISRVSVVFDEYVEDPYYG